MSAEAKALLRRRRAWLLQAAAASLGPVAGTAAWAAPQAPATRLQFPRDFGAHPETAIEWWYLTGCMAREGRSEPEFGYQLTFFRRRGPAPLDHPSALAARQLMLAHGALSDLRPGGRLRHDQRLGRAVAGLHEASEQDCQLRMGDWSLQRQNLPGGHAYQALLRSRSAGFELRLNLQTSQALLLQGDGGYSRKGPQPDQFSHYYSQVQLLSQAELRLEGQVLRLQGRSWLDHEWSNNLLGKPGAEAGASQDAAVGWDWAGINLSDGGALTVFRLRRADGSTLWSGGSWRRPDGRTEALGPEQVQLQPGRLWASPRGGARYPLEWRLRTPQGEQRLRALMDDQEIHGRAGAGIRYWEGAAELLDASGRRSGLGYLELTGYAEALKI
ncbi:lipocalin-like domain-containing protein [Paucibacter sp. B51]|uniref:lipocalin-like domain-containing protein n=1 Tax=Paucibacter sp. B51 TaxID=2993315 RepID=UPI0022EBD58D|nr:lipocalin-like domain-containing protein [Paucibacter sp. B51]